MSSVSVAVQDYDPRVRYTCYFETASVNLFLAQNGVLNRYSFRNSYWYSVHGRRDTNQPILRKAILERPRSRSFVGTKRRRATAMGCPETPFFRPQSTALHPVELLASTWCMVPQNGHLSQLPITELTGKVNICRNKVLKHSLPSIIMSPCIRLLTRLCARRSTLRLHF